MTVIENANQFVAAAARNGVTVNWLYAAVALKYFRINNENLVQGAGYKIWMEPADDPGNVSEYNIAELFELALEEAKEIHLEACMKDNAKDDDILRLTEDLYILEAAVKEARTVIPVKVKTYGVNIIEQLRKTVYVEAASCNEAEEIVRENYSKGEYGELSLIHHRISTIINVIGPKIH